MVPKGLGDGPGNLTLTTPINPQGTFRYGIAHMGGMGKDGQAYHEEVAVTTIDHFAAEEGLRRLDFTKMDVEGWEMRILEGGAATIECFRPMMLIELVDQQLARVGDSVEAAWELLDSWGYHPAVCSDGKTLTPREMPLEGDNFWLPD